MATLHIRSLKHHLALPALATGALTSALMHPSTRGTCVPRAPACLGAHPQLLCHYLLDNLLALSIYYCTQARATSSSQLLLPSIIVRFSMKRARSNPHTHIDKPTQHRNTPTHKQCEHDFINYNVLSILLDFIPQYCLLLPPLLLLAFFLLH